MKDPGARTIVWPSEISGDTFRRAAEALECATLAVVRLPPLLGAHFLASCARAPSPVVEQVSLPAATPRSEPLRPVRSSALPAPEEEETRSGLTVSIDPTAVVLYYTSDRRGNAAPPLLSLARSSGQGLGIDGLVLQRTLYVLAHRRAAGPEFKRSRAITVQAAPTVPYSSIVALLDLVRTMTLKDGSVEDLFPEVSFEAP